MTHLSLAREDGRVAAARSPVASESAVQRAGLPASAIAPPPRANHAAPPAAAAGRRRFLFLQGPCSPFFRALALALLGAGHGVRRVNFNAGDALYWGLGEAMAWRGREADLPDFYAQEFERHAVSDVVLFGDRRPVHRPAIEVAQAGGVRVHVFEEGYFRPRWVTLERGGVNGHSLLPRDPQWYWEVGASLSDGAAAQAFRAPFRQRAAHDVAYHVAGLANPVLHPRYRNHAGITAPVEYAWYVKRFAQLALVRERERQRARQLAAGAHPFYVLPLQLNTDAQIRDHSPFRDMAEVIEYVLQSFARGAPAGSQLVVKNHPLDIGRMNYRRLIADGCKRFDLAGRVHYLEDGDWTLLASHARGVVTVNSTAGMVALEHGTPTLALSDPIYALPGLTSQLPLDDFWRDDGRPDAELFRRFRRCVLHATQVNGGFYSGEAIALAARNSAQVLVAETSPLERLL